MLSGRYGSFTGGIDLPDERDTTLDQPVRPWATGERLLVPLAPCEAPPSIPIVEVGQRVDAAEKIARGSDDGSVHIFAPASGRVTAISTADVMGSDHFRTCPVIELSEIASSGELREDTVVFDWRGSDRDTLHHRIMEGGLTTHRRPPTALPRWIAMGREKRCRTLVANVMENQPCVTCDHRLLVDYPGEVAEGMAILGKAIGAEELILAVDRRRTDDYRRLVKPTRKHQITRVALPHKYPTGADPMLLKILTRREIPLGGKAQDIATAVTDAATCLAVYRWVACGIPPTGRVVTVAGRDVGDAGNFWVPFGTSCSELVGEFDGSPLHGGPMTGLRCTNSAVVSPVTNAVLAIGSDPPPAPSPCIRCGWCTDHCPARLNVAVLNDHFELGMLDQARRMGVMACVECGVCSYVCPARLPLSQRVRELKRAATEYHKLVKRKT